MSEGIPVEPVDEPPPGTPAPGTRGPLRSPPPARMLLAVAAANALVLVLLWTGVDVRSEVRTVFTVVAALGLAVSLGWLVLGLGASHRRG